VDWISLARDRGQWRAVVNTVMKLRFPEKVGNFLASRVTAFQEGFCSMELLILI
jgi:hypothetical protein